MTNDRSLGMRIASGMCLFGLLAVLSGCSAITGNVTGGPECKVKGNMLVVPFRDANNYYYDSQEGTTIADAIMVALAVGRNNVQCSDYSAARGIVRSGVLGKPKWDEAGKAAGAAFVLYGSVDSLSWRDPSDAALPRCMFTVSFRVYDVAKATDVYAAKVSGRYPYRLLADGGITVYEMGYEGLRVRSFAYIGQVVARTFQSYKIAEEENDSLTYVRDKTLQ